MKQVPRCALLLVLSAIAGCSHSSDLSIPKTQDNFGVQMAHANLWREAMFRFHRAVELNPNDAQAHNNLAVAYEANGDYDNALKEYREALRLDRSNQYIQKNYSRFVEFRSRNNKRQQKNAAASKSTSATPAPATTTTTAAEPSQASAQPVETTTAPAPAPATPETTTTAPATSTAPPPAPVPPPPAPVPPPPTPQPPTGGPR
jgi:predicted O-linked N-acetylglucosamine transferase (SPINDLY family)